MKDSLITALESMLALQRWNFLPRLETWVEAENAAYVTHLGYALGRASGMTQPRIQCLLVRSLLKSLNKHYLTDISIDVRDKLKARNPTAWTNLIDSTAVETSKLFPRKISSVLRKYLTDDPGYLENFPDNKKDAQNQIESLIRYAQYKVAHDECSVNAKVYHADYKMIINDLLERVEKIDNHEIYEKLLAGHSSYFIAIKRLKYLRRWNRINRLVATSVMGHTYLVAVLTIMFSLLCEDETTKNETFFYHAILRALFHDVPESLTGDIITPVKREIEKHDKTLLDDVEEELNQELINSAPRGVQDDIRQINLIEELNTRDIYSVDSLVKDCDRLALLLECIYEKSSGVFTKDIERAFTFHHQELAKSEWTAIREFTRVVTDHW